MSDQIAPSSQSSPISRLPKIARSKVSSIFLTLLILICIALHASWGRPIWIDEFLHFALGSHRTTTEAWDTIRQSILTFNHGQTGIYMILDYWLLQVFGASRFWLRFPSILSGLMVFASSTYLFHLWGMPFFWKIIGILALFSQGTLMFYLGEARPYMPLVAATIGTLAYYTASVTQRKNSILLRTSGIFFVILGVLFHPYFSIYWLTICLFTFIQKWIESEDKYQLSINAFTQHIDIPLSIFGSSVYFVLGYSTWLRGRPEFSFDPFEWLKKDSLSSVFLDLGHMQFIRGAVYPFLAIVISIIFLAIFSPRLRHTSLKFLLPPTILLVLTFSISIFLSFTSFLQNYWILPRQWVASMALTALASVWLAYVIFKIFANFHIFVAILWLGVFCTPVLANTQETFNLNFPHLIRAIIPIHLNYPNPLISEYSLKLPTNNDEWVNLANENILQGGAVWSVFRSYYEKDISKLWKPDF